MNNTPLWTGLESLALALIFAPEPVTTFLGVGLLAYARKKRQEQHYQAARRFRPRHSFSDRYSYDVKMVDGSAIAYHIAPARHGQLPLARSTISKLYESRDEWKIYQRTSRPRINLSRPSSLHPAGLLKTPFLRYQPGLNPRRVEI